MFLRVRGKGGSPENSQAALMYLRAFWTVPTEPTPGEYVIFTPAYFTDPLLFPASSSSGSAIPVKETTTTTLSEMETSASSTCPALHSSDGSTSAPLGAMQRRGFRFPSFLVGLHSSATTTTAPLFPPPPPRDASRAISPEYLSAIWKELWNVLDILYDEVPLFPVLPISLVNTCMASCFSRSSDQAHTTRPTLSSLEEEKKEDKAALSLAWKKFLTWAPAREMAHTEEGKPHPLPTPGESEKRSTETAQETLPLPSIVPPSMFSTPREKIAVCPHYFAEESQPYDKVCPRLNATTATAATRGSASFSSSSSSPQWIAEGVRGRRVIVLDLSSGIALTNKLAVELAWRVGFFSLQQRVRNVSLTSTTAHPLSDKETKTTLPRVEEEDEEGDVILVRLPFTHVPSLLELTGAMSPSLSSSLPPTTMSSPPCTGDDGVPHEASAGVAAALWKTMDFMGQHLSMLWEGVGVSGGGGAAPSIGFVGAAEEETVKGVCHTIAHLSTTTKPPHSRRNEGEEPHTKDHTALHSQRSGSSRLEKKGVEQDPMLHPKASAGTTLSLVWVTSDEVTEEALAEQPVLLEKIATYCGNHPNIGALKEVQHWKTPVRALKEDGEEEWDAYTQREMTRLNFCPCCGDCGGGGEGDHDHSHHHHH